MKKTVGERIKERREQLNLTQTQLAIKMGYSNRSAISRAESAGDDIGANRVVKFAEALKCTPAYLMGWTENEAIQIEYSVDEKLLIDNYRKLDQETKAMVNRLLKYNELLKKGE